jgi:hypothetical protein
MRILVPWHQCCHIYPATAEIKSRKPIIREGESDESDEIDRERFGSVGYGVRPGFKCRSLFQQQ